MAITIHTHPSTYNTAYRPLIWDVTSNRYDGITNDESISAFADYSGMVAGTVKCTTSSTNNFVTGDIITITGTTNYNGIYEITVISTTEFYFTATWVSDDATGTATRTNNNFQIKAAIYAFNNSRLTISSVANAGGGEVTITTTSVHDLTAGDYIVNEGTTDYDGIYIVESVGSTTTYNITKAYTATRTGTAIKGTFILNKYTNSVLSGSTYIFRFNLSDVAAELLTSDLEAFGSGLAIESPTDNSIITLFPLFTEQYDNVDGLLSDKDTIFSANIYKAVNATRQHIESQTLTEFECTGSSKLFLTFAPSNLYVSVDQIYQLSFLNGNVSRKIAYQTRNINGTLDPVAYSGIVRIVGGRATALIYNLLDSTKDKVDVWLVDSSNVQVSEKRTFYVDEKKYGNSEIIWFKNRYGGFDNFMFYDKKGKISAKKSYIKKPLDISFSISDRGTEVLESTGQIEYTLRTRYLSEEELFWLSTEITNSPNVYRQSNNNAIPIVVTSLKNVTCESLEPDYLEIKYVSANNIIINN